MKKLNKLIADELDNGHQIGHSYFCSDTRLEEPASKIKALRALSNMKSKNYCANTFLIIPANLTRRWDCYECAD